MEDLQFVHVELKRDTWASQKMSVRDPFDAVEVARTLIEKLDREMVHSIIMIHNHPSGSCQPSKEDLNMAKKLATVCNLVGLELKDFIVIGAYGYSHSVHEEEFEWLEPSYKWLQEA